MLESSLTLTLCILDPLSMAEMAVGAPQPGTAGDYVLYVDAPRVVKRASWRKGFVAIGNIPRMFVC